MSARRAASLACACALAAAAAVGAPPPGAPPRPAAPPPPPSAEAVQRELERVLEDPALQEGLGRSHLGTVDQGELLVTGTKSLWSAFLRWATRMNRQYPALPYLAVLLTVLVGIPVVAHLAWSLSLAFRRAGPRAEVGGPDADEAAARRRRSAELRAESRAHAAAGRMREAARALLLAFLALLDERRALVVAGSWTNREVLARLRLAPPVRARLQRFVDAADAACYGQLGPTPVALEDGEALLLELERGAGLAAPPAGPS